MGWRALRKVWCMPGGRLESLDNAKVQDLQAPGRVVC
jgi:hypothetical protein